MQFLQQAQYFASRLDRREISIEAFAAQCCRLIAGEVGCRRTSVWVLDPALRETPMMCLGSHDSLRDTAACVSRDTQADLPGCDEFLRMLERDGAVCASEARTHPATALLYESYMARHGIESLMAVAFSVNGELRGAFTCTSVDERTQWTAHQLATLKRVVARVSPALARSERRSLDDERVDFRSTGSTFPGSPRTDSP